MKLSYLKSIIREEYKNIIKEQSDEEEIIAKSSPLPMNLEAPLNRFIQKISAFKLSKNSKYSILFHIVKSLNLDNTTLQLFINKIRKYNL